ncbi:hypothetical protein NQZ68_003605 [Dissostichus eleginoides]|nr:hypothetical protein NQZ68_003605 [Dissostichus eleginoides]
MPGRQLRGDSSENGEAANSLYLKNVPDVDAEHEPPAADCGQIRVKGQQVAAALQVHGLHHRGSAPRWMKQTHPGIEQVLSPAESSGEQGQSQPDSRRSTLDIKRSNTRK